MTDHVTFNEKKLWRYQTVNLHFFSILMAFIFFLYSSLKLLCRPQTVKYLHEIPSLGENVHKIAQNGPPSQT